MKGQINALDEEKFSFQFVVCPDKRPDNAFAMAIVVQMLSIMVATPTTDISRFVGKEDLGTMTSKYREIMPKRDSATVGRNRRPRYGTRARQFLVYKWKLLLIISPADLIIG